MQTNPLFDRQPSMRLYEIWHPGNIVIYTSNMKYPDCVLELMC